MAVPKAIRSRMKCLTLKPITALQMFPRAQAIMQAENVTIQSAKLLKELELIESIGDIRKYMERLELIAIGNQSMQSSSMNMSNIFNKHGMKRVK
jgi:replication-associated recombination protein RarA